MGCDKCDSDIVHPKYVQGTEDKVITSKRVRRKKGILRKWKPKIIPSNTNVHCKNQINSYMFRLIVVLESSKLTTIVITWII